MNNKKAKGGKEKMNASEVIQIQQKIINNQTQMINNQNEMLNGYSQMLQTSNKILKDIKNKIRLTTKTMKSAISQVRKKQ